MDRDETAFIEQFRCEVANRGMKTPGFGKKEALVFADGFSAILEMSQRRYIRALRMATLLWLFQLLRVTQQNQAFSAGCTGQNVRQRHLTRWSPARRGGFLSRRSRAAR